MLEHSPSPAATLETSASDPTVVDPTKKERHARPKSQRIGFGGILALTWLVFVLGAAIVIPMIVHNPLDPGHLEPYQDHTAPQVAGLLFRNSRGERLPHGHLTGTVRIAASARDMPPLPVPGVWFGFPLAPALVAWHMTSARVSVVPQTTVADFRHREPLPRNFWRVYAPGTYQNFPVFAYHYYFHHPGRYLFNLTPQPLNTLSLPNGRYIITVNVADICGNRGSLAEQVEIANPRLAYYPPHTKT